MHFSLGENDLNFLTSRKTGTRKIGGRKAGRQVAGVGDRRTDRQATDRQVTGVLATGDLGIKLDLTVFVKFHSRVSLSSYRMKFVWP